MSINNINSAWAAVAPILREFSFYDIKDIVKLAGFDIEVLSKLGSDGNKAKLVNEIESCFMGFSDDKKSRYLTIVLEEILERRNKLNVNYDPEEKLQYNLNRLGWKLIDNKVIPIDILDSSDLNELDPSARIDLVKAAVRFRDGDLSGSILSACSAVDSVLERIYAEKSLGDVKDSAFQERCKKALDATGVYRLIDKQLSDINWKEGSLKIFSNNLQGSLNQAANVMQSLRNDMSDAHGTKPVLRSLAFDSIKWAQIIVRLLSEKVDD